MCRLKFPGGLPLVLLFCFLFAALSAAAYPDGNTVESLLRLKIIFETQKAELQKLNETLTRQEAELTSLQESLKLTEAEYKTLKQSWTEQRRLIDDLKNSIADKEASLTALKLDMQKLREALDASEASLKKAETSLTDLSKLSRERLIKGVVVAGAAGIAIGAVTVLILSAVLPSASTGNQ